MDPRLFQSPPRRFRPAPFWGINDRLTPEETARQFRGLLEAGFSGGFFHARMGLISDYLGEEWFAAFHAALKVAQEEEGYLWLYDEDCWPSGSVGGRVTAMNDDYRSTTLRTELLLPGDTPASQPDTPVVAAYRIVRDDLALREAERLPLDSLEMSSHEERLLFRRVYGPANFGCWADNSVVNYLHPEATAQFLALTHDRYAREAGTAFGAAIPGIFTDEPAAYQLCWDGIPNAFAWYDGLPERYAAWFGRDFWADLPYWFFDGPECRTIRLYLHRLINRQFFAAFTRLVADWCARHGLAFTGHYLAEEDFVHQLRAHFGGIMTHYRVMDVPGIDHLDRELPSHLVGLRQAASAARQLGRPGALCEIFGAQGDTATFADLKAIGDYNLAHGVTLFCPHHCWYGAWGRRKRDFPPNFNYQQAYWPDLRHINDYFTRISYALTQGTAPAQVLLLHPLEDAAAAHRLGVAASTGMAIPEDLSVAEASFTRFYALLDAILTAGYACDLGDEGYLAELGQVGDGALRVGAMAYPVVVMPPARTWRPTTWQLLRDFTARGGTLIMPGDAPFELDGEPAAEAWQALRPATTRLPDDPARLWQVLDAVAPRRFSLRAPDGTPVPDTYVNHRLDGDRDVLFIVNAGDIEREYLLRIANPALLTCWDAVDGTRAALAAGEEGYRFNLLPGGSLLLTTGTVGGEAPSAVTLPALDNAQIIAAPESWSFQRSEANVLVLDRMQATVDGREWPMAPAADTVARLNAHFGLTGVERYQPWTVSRDDRFAGAGGTITLVQEFRCAYLPSDAALVFDGFTPDEIRVNDQPAGPAGDAWHWDRSMRTVPVTGLLREGMNRITCRLRYDRTTELCPTCLVGDFAVRLAEDGTGVIIPEPSLLSGVPWTTQGYPHYSGAISYRTTVTCPAECRIVLRLHNPTAVLVRLRVNGRELPPLMWPPFIAEITSACTPGDNVIELDIVSSRQNTWFFPRQDGMPVLHPYGVGKVDVLAV